MSAVMSSGRVHLGVALVVVNYGSIGMTELHVSALSAEWPELDVVIVDCRTDDSERAAVRAACDRHGWTSVLLDENLGFGGGMNRGAEIALARGAEILIALNPDAVLPGQSARLLADRVRDEPMALVAPIIHRPDGSLWSAGNDLYLDDGTTAGVRHRLRHGGRAREFWVSGACFAVGVELWRRLRGLDEEFFLYWEDVDLCRRVGLVGGRCEIVAGARATHDQGGTHTDRGRGEAKSETYYYYNIRNRILFASRLSAAERMSWRRATLRVSFSILLRGGRSQLLTSVAPWRALLRGIRDGRAGVTGPIRERGHALHSGRARLYRTLRSAHLERAHQYAPAAIVYRDRRYDFDATLVEGLELVQARPLAAARLLRRSRLTVLEVNEPLMLHSALTTALAVFAVRFRRGRDVRIVAYAIENADVFALRPSNRRAVVRSVVDRAAVRYLWRQLDRVAYGTPGAEAVYRRLLPAAHRPRETTVPALPSARRDLDPGRRGSTVVFVGAFVERKGFPLLAGAWPAVAAARPAARLVLIGKGELIETARALARDSPSVTLIEDPPRARIRSVLACARILVLPSQPRPRWREQVGLPIVEGLESGCAIITTEETGLAGWLAEHGHRVLPSSADAAALGQSIIDELDRDDRSEEILAALPDVDGRVSADRWLFDADDPVRPRRSSGGDGRTR